MTDQKGMKNLCFFGKRVIHLIGTKPLVGKPEEKKEPPFSSYLALF
jgi:hypothetical protein